MTSIDSSTVYPSVIGAQKGWRKVILYPRFYPLLIAITLNADVIISFVLHPINFIEPNTFDFVRIAYFIISLTGLGLAVLTQPNIKLTYILIIWLMIHPIIIINSGLMDVRMSVHYVSIAFLIQLGQQIKQLTYKSFIVLTLVMLLFFLSLVLKPKLNVDESSLALKIQIIISMLYSAIFIFIGILVQRARSYYITIEEELSQQIHYITGDFSKISSLTSSLSALLDQFKTKTNAFFQGSTCDLLIDQSIILNESFTLNKSFLLTDEELKNKTIRSILTSKQPLLLGKSSRIKTRKTGQSPHASLLIVPLVRNKEVIGILRIKNTNPYHFNESHLHLTKLIATICAAKILEFENRQLSLQSLEIEIESQHLQELDELKYSFIENVSRSIKAPLRSLLAKTQKIEAQLTEDRQKKLIQLIRSNGNQLKNILDQLLELNEIDVTNKELKLERIDIAHLISDWKHTFIRIAGQRQIKLSIIGPTSLIISGDEKKLTSIIHNLVHNALKYTPTNGSVVVNYGQDEDNFYLHVDDSGEGIPVHYREKIFERFYRLGEADGKGTGIGLSIVKELTEIMGGKIQILDAELGGASFQFTYNLKYVEGIYPPHSFTAVEQNIIPALDDKKVVLVIDDHKDMREFICNCLGTSYACLQAENGKIGLSLAQQIIPDIIITDLMMPEMNGEELCANIRKNMELSHIPIIVLSAKSTGEDKIALYEIGADNYLVKPFEVDELMAIIKSLLQAREQLSHQFKSLYFQHDSVTEMYENKEKLFLEKVQGIILQNLNSNDFNVVSLCSSLSMGRNQTQRKIKALTGMSPVEFIRDTKLKEAALRILETDLSISQIANETGFNNLSYFTKIFKKAYGVLPSDYKNQSAF